MTAPHRPKPRRLRKLPVCCRLAALFLCLGSLALSPPLQAAPVAYDAGLDRLALSLTEGLERAGLRRITITEFEGRDGAPGALGSWLADELVERIAALPNHPQLIEREKLHRLLQEQDLFGTGRLDSTTAADLGRILGVDVIVFGTASIHDQGVQIGIQAVCVETAEVISPDSVHIDRETVPAHLLPSSGSGNPAPVGSAGPHPRILDSWQSGPLRIEALAIRRELDRKRATVDLRFVNISAEDIVVGIEKEAFGRCSMSLRDEQGAAHLPLGDDRGSGISCVTRSSTRQDFTLIPHGTTPIGMTFKANEGKEILGRTYRMNLSLVLMTEKGLKRVPAGLEGLVLDSE